MTGPTIPAGHRDGVALMAYLRNVGLEPDESFLQQGLQRLTQTVMELKAARQIGASRYERTPERKSYRDCHRAPLPQSAGAPSAHGEGPLGRGPAGVDRRG